MLFNSYGRFVVNAVDCLVILALLLLSSIPFQTAQAASLTSLSDTMSSLKISTASTHVLRFTTPTGATDNTDTIVVTFPADFNFAGKAISSVTFTHGTTTGTENTETLAAAPDATNWGAVFSSTTNRVLTLTAPSDGAGAHPLSAGHRIILTYNASSSTNPTVAGSYIIGISGTFGDAGSTTVNILNDDQVSIDAVVAQSLTFSISDNSIGFGTLSAVTSRFATGDGLGATVETEAHNIIVGTNATNGYTMTASGTTLTSGLNTITPIGATNSATTSGSEQFGIRLSASGGNGAVNAPYAASGFAFDSAAFPDQIATSTSASANTTYSVRYVANINSNTEAGSYSSIISYTATANY